MPFVFDNSELIAIFNSTVDGLEQRNPHERAALSVIRKSVEQLAGKEVKPKYIARDKPAPKKLQLAAKESGDKLGDLIAAAGKSLFGSEIKDPITVNALLPYMREAVPALPHDDHAAKVAITRAFSTREEQFERFTSDKARDPLRWYAKR